MRYSKNMGMKGMKMISEWAEVFEAETGRKLNLGTVRKRRQIADVGFYVPPKSYLLTRSEFISVLSTPLPYCHKGEDVTGFAANDPE